jgi:hypothetical protein
LVTNRVSLAVAVLITLIWASACVWAFAVNPAMVQLVTVITPVMLAATGFLFAQPILEARRRSRRENGHAGSSTPAPEDA